jgi:Ca2+:H+ antiporter
MGGAGPANDARTQCRLRDLRQLGETVSNRLVRSEWFLAVSIATSLAFLLFGDTLRADSADATVQAVVFIWLFLAILWSAMCVVRHAEHLAERLGEPLGTLILTLAVTAIEAASISAVMVHSRDQPTVMRDTVFAVIMIILNGMVGTSLLVGAWRHREQSYNLQGANIYLSVVVPLAVMSLIMPNYTHTTPGPTLSFYQQEFLGVMCIGLYAAFLAVQTGRHRGYFALEAEEDGHGHELAGGAAAPVASAWHHALLLLGYMIPVVYLAEQFGEPIDHMIRRLHAPAALGGVIIAALVATPEGIGAVRSALANKLQRSVNICLGSLLATIALTIPLMVVVAHLMGATIFLGLEGTSYVMLLLTLAVSVLTFGSGRTNVLQGAVHLILFIAYVLLIFQG